MKAITSMMAASAALITGTAMAAEKPAIALVHGAFENVHVWDGLSAKLSADGYRVIAVDLPGRDTSPMAPNQVSLDLYRDTVLKAIAGEKRPVVLVGHSFGGFPISAAAEAAPEKIKTLIYVAAYLPQDGESMLALATGDRDSKAGPQLKIDEAHGLASVNYAARADLFANGAPEGLRKVLPDLILDEPLAPMATPLHLTAARYGKTDKVYVHTAFDHVVSPWLQARMVAATPVRASYTLQTGHTPFLTDVAGLAAAIEQAAQ
ncbi:alpha/beta fold hydrolase [Duganella aceris]|uniref:Alpha/beta fold hydrolase n=1 Tax=Duganella aceris TaxID=2703883 RepID=A0ABX0FGT1_9BURK|nr:alpha/beta fold hydrolase [Duganella aceris]NGZ83729.1 alpha/beta fold hydrolase [Duganella aceris]